MKVTARPACTASFFSVTVPAAPPVGTHWAAISALGLAGALVQLALAVTLEVASVSSGQDQLLAGVPGPFFTKTRPANAVVFAVA